MHVLYVGSCVLLNYCCLCCCGRLGCPRVVLAPMVDQSELAFRLFCRQHGGCRLAYSPMLHASVIVRSAQAPSSDSTINAKTNGAAASNQQVDGSGAVPFLKKSSYLGTFFKTCREDRPLAIQLAGSSEEELSAAAGLVSHMCDIVDLNVGCPQAMVRFGSVHCAALMPSDCACCSGRSCCCFLPHCFGRTM